MQKDHQVTLEAKGRYLTIENMKDFEEQLLETRQPEMAQPGMVQPGMVQPGMVQPEIPAQQLEIQPPQTVHCCPVFSLQLR
jgi:hypothetical protein